MDMKTYKAKERLGRLVAYLIATKKPFVFDGEEIEFIATDRYMACMAKDDAVLATVRFVEL